MLTRKLLSVIDNIIVDVFKIISESTDSFMVNVTVSLAQLLGHSRGTRFYSRGPCPGCPSPLAPPLSHMQLINSACKQGRRGRSHAIAQFRAATMTTSIFLSDIFSNSAPPLHSRSDVQPCLKTEPQLSLTDQSNDSKFSGRSLHASAIA